MTGSRAVTTTGEAASLVEAVRRPTRLGRISSGPTIDAVAAPGRTPFRGSDAPWTLIVGTTGSQPVRRPTAGTVSVRPSALVLIPPNAVGWDCIARADTPSSDLVVAFAGPIFDLLADLGVLTDEIAHYPDPTANLGRLRALLEPKPRTDSDAERQVMSFAGWLVETLRSPESTNLSTEVEAALAVLDRDVTASLTMPEVAESVGLSYHAFRRTFAREMHQSASEYRAGQRLRTAADLLATTSMTVGAVARALGYVDQFHLSRRFREHFGVAPSEYRRRG